MMELNGSKYLTNEELAVINAMRMGGKAQVNFFRSDYENKDLFFYRRNMDVKLTSYFEAKSEKVTMGHFIDK